MGLWQTDTGIGGIEYGVEALEKNVAVDEIDTCIRRTHVADNEVDEAAATTNVSIEGTRPDLAVRCESIGVLCSRNGERGN